MRTLVIFFTLILAINLKVYNHTIDTSIYIVNNIQELPVFPGGPENIWCFLESNFKYDILNVDQKTVSYFISFYIDSLGMARGFRFIDIKPGEINNVHTDSLKRNEILRVLELMPKWEVPVEFNNKLKCWFMVPVKTPYTEFRCKKTHNSQ